MGSPSAFAFVAKLPFCGFADPLVVPFCGFVDPQVVFAFAAKSTFCGFADPRVVFAFAAKLTFCGFTGPQVAFAFAAELTFCGFTLDTPRGTFQNALQLSLIFSKNRRNSQFFQFPPIFLSLKLSEVGGNRIFSIFLLLFWLKIRLISKKLLENKHGASFYDEICRRIFTFLRFPPILHNSVSKNVGGNWIFFNFLLFH